MPIIYDSSGKIMLQCTKENIYEEQDIGNLAAVKLVTKIFCRKEQNVSPDLSR